MAHSLPSTNAARMSFMHASAEQQNKTMVSQKRNRLALGAVAVLVLTLTPIALFSFLVQEPVTQRANLFFDANSLADNAPLSENYPKVGGATKALGSLITAADKIREGTEGGTNWQAKLSEYLPRQLRLAPRHRPAEDLSRPGPPASGASRQRTTARGPFQGAVERRKASTRVDRLRTETSPETYPAECTIVDAETRHEDRRTGAPIHTFGNSRRASSPLQRGIFVPDSVTPRIDQIELRAAAVDGTSGKCVSTHVILPVPRYLEPLIRFDAAMRYLLVADLGARRPFGDALRDELGALRRRQGLGRTATAPADGRDRFAAAVEPSGTRIRRWRGSTRSMEEPGAAPVVAHSRWPIRTGASWRRPRRGWK